MRPARLAALAILPALLACTEGGETAATGSTDPAAAAAAPGTAAPQPELALPGGQAQATAPQSPQAPAAQAPAAQPRRDVDPEDVPIIFMALQDGGSQPDSVVFALDSNRDGSPRGERAIRMTPEAGRCNPQELTSFDFPAGTDPVFSFAEAQAGVTMGQLPDYLAVRVSQAMMERGLAADPEGTKPLNLCTRNLWQNLIRQEIARQQGEG